MPTGVEIKIYCAIVASTHWLISTQRRTGRTLDSRARTSRGRDRSATAASSCSRARRRREEAPRARGGRSSSSSWFWCWCLRTEGGSDVAPRAARQTILYNIFPRAARSRRTALLFSRVDRGRAPLSLSFRTVPAQQYAQGQAHSSRVRPRFAALRRNELVQNRRKTSLKDVNWRACIKSIPGTIEDAGANCCLSRVACHAPISFVPRFCPARLFCLALPAS